MDPNLLTVRCQTVVDGELAYVQLPVTRELWETSSTVREVCRDRARKELRYAVEERAGVDLLADRAADLPVWVEYPDACEVECVGGPADGQRIKLSSGQPPAMVRVPQPVNLADQLANLNGPLHPADYGPLIATYEPLTDDHGFFARSTDGAWRYGWRP